jgi:hypothetical protein
MSFDSYDLDIFEVVTEFLKKFIDNECLIHVVNVAESISFIFMKWNLIKKWLRISSIELQSTDYAITKMLESLVNQHEYVMCKQIR